MWSRTNETSSIRSGAIFVPAARLRPARNLPGFAGAVRPPTLRPEVSTC